MRRIADALQEPREFEVVLNSSDILNGKRKPAVSLSAEIKNPELALREERHLMHAQNEQ